MGIQEVLGILCYSEPASSPLGYLMENGQRQLTADIVNECLLEFEGLSKDTVLELNLKRMLLLQELYYKESLGCHITSLKLA